MGPILSGNKVRYLYSSLKTLSLTQIHNYPRLLSPVHLLSTGINSFSKPIVTTKYFEK